MQEKQEYLSYNVLARKALMFGVPVITFLILLFLIVASFFAGIVLFGAAGLIAPLFLTALLFGIRLVCMDDSRAMESVMWNVRGALSRLRCQSSVVSFTSTNDTPTKRKDHVRQFIKDHTHSQ